MKAKLEFDLDDADDRMDHLRCIKSLDMASTLFEIRNIKRKHLKYGILSDVQYEMVEKVFEDIESAFESNSIDMDELIR